jgi:hypothetical protein
VGAVSAANTPEFVDIYARLAKTSAQFWLQASAGLSTSQHAAQLRLQARTILSGVPILSHPSTAQKRQPTKVIIQKQSPKSNHQKAPANRSELRLFIKPLAAYY